MSGTALVVGLIPQVSGSLLLLFVHTAVIGGVILIVFVIAADAMLHRFWTP